MGNICYSPLVIDALDSMKKGRENYAAREAIKFLERNLQGGGKMMRVQGPEETLQSPGTRKPPKMDLNTWSAMPYIIILKLEDSTVTLDSALRISLFLYFCFRYSPPLLCSQCAENDAL